MKQIKVDIFIFIIPLTLFLVFFILANSFTYPSAQLTNAITLDFIITTPLVYFLLIKRTAIPNYTAITVAVISIFVASYILPHEHQSLLSSIKLFIIPVVEVGILAIIVYKFSYVAKEFRRNKNEKLDFYDVIKSVCESSFPKPINAIIAMEIAVFSYAFNLTRPRQLEHNEFSYHKRSGSAMVLGLLILILLVETFAIHFLLAHWSNTLAWILSAISIYTCFQIIALIRSFARRPSYIDLSSMTLNLKYGFFAETTIKIQDIGKIEETSRGLAQEFNMVKFSAIDSLDNHNLILFLHEPCIIKKVYGENKSVSTLAIYIDNKEDFLQQIQNLS